jgi:hypothetical protein
VDGRLSRERSERGLGASAKLAEEENEEDEFEEIPDG